jgi:hypothetical protein
VVWSGLEGSDVPPQNFAPTFVFATFWLGLVFLSVLLGDVFRAFNPWRAIAAALSGVFRLVARQDAPSTLTYPERLGRWPAVAGLLGFLWFELVYSAGGTEGLSNHELVVAVLVYTVITFVGMALFGIEAWIRRGETFSVYFGMFATLAPIEVRDGALGLRRPLTASTRWAVLPGSVALVMVALGGTVFDGAQEGLLKEPIEWLFERLQDLGADPSLAARLANSAFLFITVGFVSGVYWLGIRGMRTVRGLDLSVGELGRVFVHSFIPIALAYLVAHYFTYFVWLEHRLRGARRQRRLVRAGRGARHRPRHGAGARPRQGGGPLPRRARRGQVAVLDARADGRLHLAGAVPALAGEPVALAVGQSPCMAFSAAATCARESGSASSSKTSTTFEAR